MSPVSSGAVEAVHGLRTFLAQGTPWARVSHAVTAGVRWLSVHTGLPALLVAAILVVVGYRLLKRTARFAVEVVVIALLLLAATHLGWVRW